MVDRDCNSCRFYAEEDPTNIYCMNCMMAVEKLPKWEPTVEEANV